MHIPNSGFPFIVFYSSDVESEETHPAQSKLGARTAAGLHARHLVCVKSNRARVAEVSDPYDFVHHRWFYVYRRDSPRGCPFSGAESLRHGYAVPPPFHKGGSSPLRVCRERPLCRSTNEAQCKFDLQIVGDDAFIVPRARNARPY